MAKFKIVARHWDQIKSKPHEPLVFTRHTAGDVVEIPKAEADRLLKAGAIEPPGRAAPSPAAAPAAPPAATTPAADTGTAVSDPADDKTAELERPKLTATTAVWQEYAIASGVDPDEVVDMGRDELIAKMADL